MYGRLMDNIVHYYWSTKSSAFQNMFTSFPSNFSVTFENVLSWNELKDNKQKILSIIDS